MSVEKMKVFMIMPFEDTYFEVFEMLKRELGESFDFSHAGTEENQQNILKDIIQPLYEADVVIADLTGLNPNVLYELGVAHTFNKKTIVITQDDLAKLPFDLKQYRAKDYTTHFVKFAQLLEYMRRNLTGALTGDVIYSNPIKDFLVQSDIDNTSWFTDECISITIDDSEKGFLDFIAGIEENIEATTKSIYDMTSDMQIMTEGISKIAVSIEKANNSGGNSASIVRIEAIKAAGCIDKFSKKLKTHNAEFEKHWDAADKDAIGLLENSLASKEENRDSLIFFLKELKKLPCIIATTKDSILAMKNASLNNLGMQRTLDQSIRFLDADLRAFIGLMDSMTTSIERIINKSKFVVGEIDFTSSES